ncbi:hypothetical protein HYU10_02660 [Candidatus Woesearchaeota archaeon]|nr:hypothetical protein [Candidatus Woesearchaeota archaeon]
MKKQVMILLVIIALFNYGCVNTTSQIPGDVQDEPKQAQAKNQPIIIEKCPDSVCDDFEMARGICPEDCKDAEGWQERIMIPGKEIFEQQAQQNRDMPPECAGISADGINLPEACKNWFSMPGSQPEQPIMPEQQGPPEKDMSVKALQSSYKTTTAKPSGWFKTGQDADIMLSGIGFDDAGGPLQFNHPGGLSTDGRRLILADRFNNRILIWNNLPSGNTAPDMVLGQKDFTANSPGKSLDELDWPVAAATDGERLVVADTYNDRLLIWNRFPTTNGQPADIEIKNAGRGQYADPKMAMEWPWAVWTDGKKLIATATRSAAVLIWNSFPTKNNQPADISITLPESIGTPRTVGSDGEHLVVGDHNLKVKGKEGPGNFFWKKIPAADNQPYDFIILSGEEPPRNPSGQFRQKMGDIFWGPSFTSDGKLIALGERLYIWNSFPEDEDDLPDLPVGALQREAPGYKFVGGDGSGVAAAGDKVYISLYNGNKIVGYNSIPMSFEQKPDFALGSPDIDANTLDSIGFITNPVIETDGKSLFVSSDFDGRLSVWKNIPDESGAKPDFIYDLEMSPWDSELFNGKLILAGKDKVYIWNSLPLNGEMPETKFKGNIGSAALNDIRGVALDEKYFYLADSSKIYVWEGIPEKNSEPKFSIDALGAGRLSSDGKYLAVAATDAPSEEMIKVFRIGGLSSSSKPVLLWNKNFWLNLPQGILASGGYLFIADTGFNRVMVWDSIDDAVSGKSPDVVLGEENLDDTLPEIGRDKLFWPAGLAFDGSYLWAGEFKFSGRILRFSVGK